MPASQRASAQRRLRRIIVTLVSVAATLGFGYTAICLVIATQLVYVPQVPIKETPAALNLSYRDVTFPSRDDHVQLKGWLIPGVLPDGTLTTKRTIILVHGTRTNRSDPAAGLLNLSGDLARQGFAVLAFDMRGMGESPPAPLSLGYFEQRDVLGAYDFLHSGTPPYPELGRPQAIGGWGVSMGGATLLMAAAQEPGIQAVVSDAAYADIVPILERVVPQTTKFPIFTPGVLVAAQALYGMNFYAVRPVDIVAKIAPRPIFFIQGTRDGYIPFANMATLANAARQGNGAQVQTWAAPGSDHAQSYNDHRQEYVQRITAFYTAALGPAT